MQLLAHFKELTIHPKNAEELKGLILQLAVQGKLTKNWRDENPDVEPASVLLEKIAAEKARLLPENYIKKDKSLPSLSKKDTSVELPRSWAYCRFADIVINRDGERRPITKSDRVKGDYDYYGASGIIDKVKGYIFEKDLLLIGEDGANLIARSTPIAFFAKGKYWVNNHAHVLDATDFTILEYLEKFINGINLEAYITGMAQPKMPQKRMNVIPISLPPLEEQKAIVSIVNQLFKEVESLEEQTKARIRLKEDFVTSALQQVCTGDTATEWTFLQEHFKTFFTGKTAVKKLRESILQLAVQGKLTSSWREGNPELVSGGHAATVLLEKIKAEKAQLVKDKKIKKEKPLPKIGEDEIPYELPEGWVWCRLGDIAEKLGAGSTPLGGKSAYVDDGIMFFRSQNIHNYFLKLGQVAYIPDSTHQKMSGTQVRSKDLLLNITGGSIGRCALVPDDFDTANVSQHVAIVRLVELELRHYLHSLIVSEQFQKTIMDV